MKTRGGFSLELLIFVAIIAIIGAIIIQGFTKSKEDR
jgi:type II secretory pathway pseudopilin PulG